MVRSPPPLSVSGSSGSNNMHMPLTPRTRKALTHNPFLMLGLLALIAIGMAALCLVVSSARSCGARCTATRRGCSTSVERTVYR